MKNQKLTGKIIKIAARGGRAQTASRKENNIIIKSKSQANDPGTDTENKTREILPKNRLLGRVRLGHIHGQRRVRERNDKGTTK